MRLKSLEVTGFKSFAKKAVLGFHTSITAIVGPNGSGKSNVAEAFRFVLGEQSIKSLRGKRGEDLIFNGGGEGSRVNRASVKVVFDNTGKMFNIDFDEVTIERVVHRDSTNEYLVNGSQVRLKDVVELLSHAHIGASGHHIISQGEADRILNANIRERREMIEDALGLKIYQYKKEESKRKLEKTEENMDRVESLRREIAPHLKFLKKQVEKVEKVRELRDELRALYREYFSREEAYLKAERARIDRERSAPAKELNNLDKDLAQAKAHLEAAKGKDKKRDELIDVESRLAGVRQRKDAVMRDLGAAQGELSALRRAIERERDEQARDDSRTVYFKDIESLVKRALAIESIAEIRKILSDFVASHRGISDTARIEELEKEVAGMEKRRQSLDRDLSQAEDDERKYTRIYHEVQEAIEKEKDTNRDAEKDVFRIIARQNELRGVLAGLKVGEDKLNLEEEAWKMELKEAYSIAGREAMDYQTLRYDDGELRKGQEDRRKMIEKIKIRIEDSGAGNSGEIMKEYKEVEERDSFLARELEDLGKSKTSLLALIADLDARLDLEFKEGILKINVQFQRFFSLMFGGGTASLEVVKEKKRKRKSLLSLDAGDDMSMDNIGGSSGDGEDEEDSPDGIDISVNLPRKKVKSLMMLSGGERALTSIALLFAVSQVNPPPFIILDETDAALDEANSRKYGDMIEDLSKLSELILITHNRETMSRAGVLYGVTMGSDGASKLLSIHFDEAVAVAK